MGRGSSIDPLREKMAVWFDENPVAIVNPGTLAVMFGFSYRNGRRVSQEMVKAGALVRYKFDVGKPGAHDIGVDLKSVRASGRPKIYVHAPRGVDVIIVRDDS